VNLIVTLLFVVMAMNPVTLWNQSSSNEYDQADLGSYSMSQDERLEVEVNT